MIGASRLIAAAALGGVLGCVADRAAGPPNDHAPPSILAVQVAPNPLNALSLTVTVRAVHADSVRAWVVGDSIEAPPVAPVRGDSARLVVLGLRPTTSYTLRVEAANVVGDTARKIVTATTDDVPPLLRGVRLAGGRAPSQGYTLVVPVQFGPPDRAWLLAFDRAGDLRWYREFDGEGWGVEAKQLPNGDFAMYVGASYGWQPSSGRFVEFAASGEEVRSFRVDAPAFTDPHEALFTFRDSAIVTAHLLGYELRTVDLSAVGGAAAATLAVHVIERVSSAGPAEIVWNAGDHYSVSDWPVANPRQPDLVHPSSLALAPDGNYVISLQAVDEVAKIDARTGALLWRLGGRNNQFAFPDDPYGGIQGQHSVQLLANGNLLLLDDRPRAPAQGARAVEYALDVDARVARLVWAYRPVPTIVSPIMGSVQRLSNGHTVVGFGVSGRVDEVDGDGVAITSATLVDALGARIEFYRALRIASLHRYAAP